MLPDQNGREVAINPRFVTRVGYNDDESSIVFTAEGGYVCAKGDIESVAAFLNKAELSTEGSLALRRERVASGNSPVD